MHSRLVYVQNSRGNIVWKNTYTDMEEMLNDIRVLEKPSVYGTDGFRIVIQMG